MGLVKGGFLRLLQTVLYFICFCCAAVVLGIYSYFLAVQADRDEYIPTWQKAVEGLSGAAVLYTIFAVVLTCCLAGVSFFSFLGLVMDILFVGAFIAIAIMTRDGASSCSGYVNTPLGNGDVNSQAQGYGGGDNTNYTYAVKYYTACRLNTAAFAVSIIAIIFFLITAAMQIALARSHKKDKRFGPSPDNGYTSGPAKKRNFWTRKSKRNNLEKDAELGAATGTLAAPHHNHHTRASHDTATTAVGTGVAHDKYETAPAPVHGTHGGYYTQPTGTGANPYGYENTTAGNTYTTGTATNY
ncbi:hypothetical protein AMS68_003347 [Peltaster fructicola]|uniref:MARVEL domain-containing protein n=1 Tax=Peltaster fructicola TaxID=286661 RepID=A0A6H0XTP4_9PEZI|nr:hypothetical protein AMS68_003347 [Peltaster fructicola]